MHYRVVERPPEIVDDVVVVVVGIVVGRFSTDLNDVVAVEFVVHRRRSFVGATVVDAIVDGGAGRPEIQGLHPFRRRCCRLRRFRKQRVFWQLPGGLLAVFRVEIEFSVWRKTGEPANPRRTAEDERVADADLAEKVGGWFYRLCKEETPVAMRKSPNYKICMCRI